MEEIREHKCPCCGAPLLFNANTQNLHCDSCGNDFSLETMQQLDETSAIESKPSKYDWDAYEPRDFSEQEVGTLSGYVCPSCGAEIVGDDTMGATICPYCGNAAIVQTQFEGKLAPDYLIPFQLDKKAAMEAFLSACGKAPFLPDEFKDKKKIEEMAGVYVPFWMFDCDCEADISYKAQRTTSWSDSQYDYVKTSYYKLLRSGKIGFANLPVDGSVKADDAYMEAIEPFDYGAAVPFNTAYLSGFLADKYDVSAEDSKERANNRVKNSTVAAFAETTNSYSAVTAENTAIAFSNGKIRYSLLPVWMLNIKYGGQNYKYAINGQTGKVVGEYPVSKQKQWMHFAKKFGLWFAGFAAAAAVYLYIL